MFDLTITNVEEVLFHGQTRELLVPGVMGQMTILPNHSPIITGLGSGNIRVKTEEDEINFQVVQGILEVRNNSALILLS